MSAVKCSQLRTVSELSALVAGFTMVVLVEAAIPATTPQGLVVAFGTVTALVVTMMLSSMVGCSILMAGLLSRQSAFADRKAFIHFWVNRCDDKWKRSFRTFMFGIPLFLIDLCLLG